MAALIGWTAAHPLLLLLAAGTVFNVIWLMLCRGRLHISFPAALAAAAVHTAAGVLCVKAFAVVEVGFDLRAAGNMSLFGGVFFMPGFYWLAAKVTRRRAADVFDVCAVCMIFTLMCARISCIVTGCCAGRAIPGTGLFWPTREAEIVFYLILLVWLGRRVRQNREPGTVYPIYMISYGVFRFIVEWFRVCADGSLLHRGHVWALISLMAGMSIYYTQRENQRKTRRVHKK